MSANSNPDITTSGSAASGRSGRGRQRGNRGGRGQINRNQPVFKGSTDAMNGHVFECYDEQSDRCQYAKTVEALEGYVKKTLKYSEDLAPLFAENMKVPTLTMPEEPGTEAGKTAEMIFTEEIKEYVKRTRTLKSNLATLHAVIWGQCSEAMKAKVKSHDSYKDRSVENDCFWFLKQHNF